MSVTPQKAGVGLFRQACMRTLASSPVAAFSDAGSDAGFDEGSNVSRKA